VRRKPEKRLNRFTVFKDWKWVFEVSGRGLEFYLTCGEPWC